MNQNAPLVTAQLDVKISSQTLASIFLTVALCIFTYFAIRKVLS